MADSAFKPAPFPAFTTAALKARIAGTDGNPLPLAAETAEKMVAEIARREAVAAGDVSQMTPAERLRRVRAA
jgi:hypothetical protein